MEHYINHVFKIFVAAVVCGNFSLSTATAGNFSLFTAEHDAGRMGMSGAGSALTSIPAFNQRQNPASVALYDGKADAAISYSRRNPLLQINDFAFGGTMKIKNRIGVGGILSYNTLKSYVAGGGSGTSEEYTPSSYLMYASFSLKISESFSAGLNTKYWKYDLYTGYSYESFAGDLSFAGKYGINAFSVGICNLGLPVKSASEIYYHLPAYLYAGYACEDVFYKVHSLKFCSDLNYFLSGTLSLSAGMEYGFDKSIFLRTGYGISSVKSPDTSFGTVGIGAKADRFKIDLSYIYAGKYIKNSWNVTLRASL